MGGITESMAGRAAILQLLPQHEADRFKGPLNDRKGAAHQGRNTFSGWR